MPRRAQEVEILRRQNRWYIDEAVTVVQFVPYRTVKSAAGGTTYVAQTPRMPQKVRLIALDRERITSQSTQDPNSRQTEVPVEVIGDVDLIVERYDRFTVDGVEFRILEVEPLSSAPYLRRAQAVAMPPDGA